MTFFIYYIVLYRLAIISLLLLFPFFSSTAQPVERKNVDLGKVQHIKLVTARGKSETLNVDDRKPLLLFVFLSPECPLCKNYTAVLNDLDSAYSSRVAMAGIIPGRTYPPKDIRLFADEFSVSFPLYIDHDKTLTSLLQARITPEVLLVGNDGAVIYSGAIDNWVAALGKTRAGATQHYLRDAIDGYLNNMPIAVQYKEPKGCFINEF